MNEFLSKAQARYPRSPKRDCRWFEDERTKIAGGDRFGNFEKFRTDCKPISFLISSFKIRKKAMI